MGEHPRVPHRALTVAASTVDDDHGSSVAPGHPPAGEADMVAGWECHALVREAEGPRTVSRGLAR